MNILKRFMHAIRIYYVLYVDSQEFLENAIGLIRPLPDGCEYVKLTPLNKQEYKCQWNVEQMMQSLGYAWVIVNGSNEVIAYHHGTHKNNNSMFFKVLNCDYEHTEIMVDERYRRMGLAVYLLYHAINDEVINGKIHHVKVGTMIRPDNISSLKLHEHLGFKISHKVLFFHMARVKDGHFVYYNYPHLII